MFFISFRIFIYSFFRSLFLNTRTRRPCRIRSDVDTTIRRNISRLKKRSICDCFSSFMYAKSNKGLFTRPVGGTRGIQARARASGVSGNSVACSQLRMFHTSTYVVNIREIHYIILYSLTLSLSLYFLFRT